MKLPETFVYIAISTTVVLSFIVVLLLPLYLKKRAYKKKKAELEARYLQLKSQYFDSADPLVPKDCSFCKSTRTYRDYYGHLPLEVFVKNFQFEEVGLIRFYQVRCSRCNSVQSIGREIRGGSEKF